MVSFTLFAGGYTASIVSYLFNADTHTLSLLHTFPTGANTTWISLHPTKPLLYAVNAVDAGLVQAFKIKEGGMLEGPVANVSTGGAGPNFVQFLSTGEIAATNYRGGNGRVVKVERDGISFKDEAPVITFPANGSHPHEVVETAPGRILIPDLGADKIWKLKKGENGTWGIYDSIAQPAGSGPRHIAIIDDLLFTLHELDSTLTTQRLSAKNQSTILSRVSTLPTNASAAATWAAAEILAPPPLKKGGERLIYVSNRNVSPKLEDRDPTGDTIAIYAFGEHGNLSLVDTIWTGISQPRGLAFSGTPRAASIHGAGKAEYLAVGGVEGDGGVVIYKRTDGGRNLQEVARDRTVPTRTSFVWV